MNGTGPWSNRPAHGPWPILPPMEHPICALCGKPIKPTDNKVTIQGVMQHMRCWDGVVLRRVEVERQ
jgi:hypothetical protein